MNLNAELTFFIITNLLTVGVTVGIYVATIKFMQKQIEDLKMDMKKYNNMLERMIVAEQNIKAIWHVVDEVKER